MLGLLGNPTSCDPAKLRRQRVTANAVNFNFLKATGYSTMNSSTRIARIILFLCAGLTLAGCLESESGDSAALTSTTPPSNSTNSAPSISGNPPSAVNVGDSYMFSPNATDPDGDSLTYSIQNQPSWLNFDSSTGAISGIPQLGDIGLYTNIVITVSDGQASATTSTFSIDVTQVQLGSVTLSWTAPTQNTDGSTLTDLAAYRIYYGTSQGSYPNQIRIDNSGTTSFVVDNLVPDTYFFVATAINSQGIESDFSSPAQIVVN